MSQFHTAAKVEAMLDQKDFVTYTVSKWPEHFGFTMCTQFGLSSGSCLHADVKEYVSELNKRTENHYYPLPVSFPLHRSVA